MPFALRWMDLKIVIPSEVSQTKKDNYHMVSLRGRTLKKLYKWIYLQNRNRVADVENKPGYQGGKEGGGINWETETDIYTLLCI